MKKCFICNKPANYVVGIALGFSGNDYNFCEICIKKTTMKQIVDKILEKEENEERMD